MRTRFVAGLTGLAVLAAGAPHSACAAQVDISYAIAARGASAAELASLAATAARAYGDARGWSLWGRVQFRRVSRGAEFTLWLSAPDEMTSFSSDCSARWSCTVGNDVVVNERRFDEGSPYWNGDLQDYQIMVVNHETGHWLGLDHATCHAPGLPGPVMMQQSKGVAPCRPNPWPLAFERISVAQRLDVDLEGAP